VLPPKKKSEDGEKKSEGTTDSSGDCSQMFFQIDEHDRVAIGASRSKRPHGLASCEQGIKFIIVELTIV
jgi:hypothetical protein